MSENRDLRDHYAYVAATGAGGDHWVQIVGMRPDGVHVVWCANCGAFASGYDKDVNGEALELFRALRREYMESP